MQRFLITNLSLILSASVALSQTPKPQTVPSQPPKVQAGRHVVLISVDGFHPDMYLDPSWPAPNLRELMKQGTYADHMLSTFPAYTYPSHTAMVTGAYPARSGIWFNQPKGSKGEWNWYTSAIRVTTLWQVLKLLGFTTAAVEWPVSVEGNGAEKNITWNIPEIWDIAHPDDRVTAARVYATPGLVEEVERNATGRLDSTNMSDGYNSLDENAGRMAAYIFKTYKPAFLAVHFAEVDGAEHDHGRDGDSVRLALASNDRAIGDILEAIHRSGLQDSTTVIIVGDHGFSTIHTVFRPNMLIKDIPARFIAAGGSAFLYVNYKDMELHRVKDSAGIITEGELIDRPRSEIDAGIVRSVTARLARLPEDKRKLFRIMDRKELDSLGADSAAILALNAVPGIVFSGSQGAANTTNNGPGTLIQRSPLEGLFIPTHGGHHGYDPRTPEMYTGFIAAGAGINRGASIREIRVTDIAPLIARLLGIQFPTPDGKIVPGICN